MKISEELYNKLIQKQFYKFICGTELYDCFIHNGEDKRFIKDKSNVESVINKYKIFQHCVDTLDYEIYMLFHHEIHSNGEPYIKLVKPTISSKRTIWLDSGLLQNDLLSDDSIIESNVDWNSEILR